MCRVLLCCSIALHAIYVKKYLFIFYLTRYCLCVCVCQAVEEFLAELRCREQSQNATLVSQITAVKFLMARKFDVSRAIDLFQAYKVTSCPPVLVQGRTK